MSKRKILWVEDDQDWCRKMEGTFGRKYDIVFVNNQNMAIEELHACYKDVSLVVVDLHLDREMDGVEVIKTVKSTYSTLPVVVVTNGRMSEGMLAKESGADVVLGKSEIDAEGWNEIFENAIAKPIVFLSHSSSDKPLVRIIKKELENAWIEVWLDEDKILLGDVTVTRIAEGISNASVVLIFISRRAMEDSNWVQDEVEHARTLNTKNGGYPRIIPVVLEKDLELPTLLEKFSELYLYEINDKLHSLIDDVSLEYKPEVGHYTVNLEELKEKLKPAIGRLQVAVNA